MQLSHYIKKYTWEKSPDEWLLFSTKRASKIVLHEETIREIENGELSADDEATLVDVGMLVEDREEEIRGMAAYFDEMNAMSKIIQVTAVLNLDCNFACPYCYEGDMKGNLYMTEETAGRLVEFVKEKLTADKTGVLVDFYGGEPLMSLGMIRTIADALKTFTESRGASLKCTLVSNGSLFKRKIAEELTGLGLESIKITLDGPAELHDKSRPFKNGAGSFDVLIGNIKETWDLLKVGIGGNYERFNYKRFPALLDDLLAEGLTPDKIHTIKFDPVMKHPGGDAPKAPHKGGCLSINEPWISEASEFLREEILKRGYKTTPQRPMTCIIESPDTHVINFDGSIYKCPAFMGKPGYRAGSLGEGLADYSGVYNLGAWKNHEECVSCEYLPLCYGGCRYMTYTRDGNIDALDCKRDYLDASLETMVKQDIEYGLKA